MKNVCLLNFKFDIRYRLETLLIVVCSTNRIYYKTYLIKPMSIIYCHSQKQISTFTNNNTYLSCIRKLLKNACTHVNKMTQNRIEIRRMQIA